jgi:hypothetical protein
VAGRLYRVEEDYQVGRSLDGYDAVGCGWEVALGALRATRDLGLEAGERLGLALDAAAHHCAGVVAPFNLVSTSSERSNHARSLDRG